MAIISLAGMVGRAGVVREEGPGGVVRRYFMLYEPSRVGFPASQVTGGSEEWRRWRCTIGPQVNAQYFQPNTWVSISGRFYEAEFVDRGKFKITYHLRVVDHSTPPWIEPPRRESKRGSFFNTTDSIEQSFKDLEET